jgi:hypothetical protein
MGPMNAIRLMALEQVGREITPVLVAGFAAAFFLSRWSPLPTARRSQAALLFSASFAAYDITCLFLEGSHKNIYYQSVSTFGLAFAISRLRTMLRPWCVPTWICAVFHFLVLAAIPPEPGF